MAPIPARIRTLSRLLRIIALLSATLLPILVALLWSQTAHWADWGITWSDAFRICGITPAQLAPSQRLLGFLTDLPALVAGSAAFFILAGICRRYGQGELFSAAVARAYRRFALALLIWGALRVLAQTLLVLALTLDLPPGQQLVVISISSDTLAMGLLGLAVYLLGQVMEEGRRLQEDNALIL
ncbi:hypothetical protein AZSI13_11540 [Azospira sp. I13]|uniref:DUF2975 domain-containing protein n=1 Tax=Azospira sp. I13 TaxID=1765050 RepID=UPI000D45801E|nr:DUF2975 domain-containing protein [Azospira sp. I13]GBG01827.1 hypothetical protein AZSI13_11540 [Azospira sp. I13]